MGEAWPRRVIGIMQIQAEGRVGIAGEIISFVVAEDKGLSAQAKRALEQRHAQLRHLFGAYASPIITPVLRGCAVVQQKCDWFISHAIWRKIGSFIATMIVLVALVRHIVNPFQCLAPRKSNGSFVRFDGGNTCRRVAQWPVGVLLGLISLLALGFAILLPDQDSGTDIPPHIPHAASTSVPLPLPEATKVSLAPVDATAEAPVVAPAVLTLKPVEEVPWTPVRRPIAMYNLEAQDVEGADFSLAVAMRGKITRQDRMVWTAKPDKTGVVTRPNVHLVVERFEQQHPTQKPLFSDLAARAAEIHHSLERMSSPDEMMSKFGVVQIADATLSADGKLSSCLVFRRVDMIGLTLTGWYCAAPGKAVDRVSLSCFLNRLDLVGAGQDLALKRYFAEAERNRGSCASARQSGRRITWLDHEAPLPPLKLSAKTR